MNKIDLVMSVANKTGKSREFTEQFIDTLIEVVSQSLINGEKIKLVDFGNFQVKNRAAKKGHNPHTNEIYDIPACKAPVFTAGKGLKELINK